MSNYPVTIVTVKEISPHPNPEVNSLEVINCLGYSVVIKKDMLRVGDRILYIPPGVAMTEDFADYIGVKKYLSRKMTDKNEERYVVKSIRLKGLASHGVFVKVDMPPSVTNYDFSEALDLYPYYPPCNGQGRSRPEIAGMPRYTEVVNLRTNSYLMKELEGKEVVLTEKINGTNSRVASVDNTYYAGSKRELKELEENTLYNLPLKHPGVKQLLDDLSEDGQKRVVAYGEIAGQGVQKMNYGINGKDYFLFDVLVNDQWLKQSEVTELCIKYNINRAPVLYRGVFDINIVKQEAEKKSTIDPTSVREGVVIRVENYPPVKYVSDNHLTSGIEEVLPH